MPKTIEYYETQLTEFLMSERYEQAAEVLRLLQHASGVDAGKRQQWAEMLTWMEMMFPELLFHSGASDSDDQKFSEEELRYQTLSDKISQQNIKPGHLLESLRATDSPDEQLVMLERLSYSADPEAVTGIRGWLTERERNPLLQFKALQALKRLGDEEQLQLNRFGDRMLVCPADTPSEAGEIPPGIVRVFQLVKSVSDSTQPVIGDFSAQMMWDFIAISFGTSLYNEMAQAEEGQMKVWASALHVFLETHVFGGSVPDQIWEIYDVSSEQMDEWEHVYRQIECFFGSSRKG